MSMASATSPWQAAWGTTTIRQFQRALLIGLLAAMGTCLIYLVENYALRLERQFVESPVEVAMRALAMAHFTIAWLFLFTSPRLRNRQALCRLGVTTLLGAGLCLLFAHYGATRNPLLVMFFYGYFLVHEVRDEALIYQAYGDAPAAGPDNASLLKALSLATTTVMMTALTLSYLAYITLVEKMTPLDQLPPGVVPAIVALLLLASGYTVYRCLQTAYRVHGSLQAFAFAYQPLLMVYAAILAILLLGSTLGSTGFNLIILLHVVAWLVFVPYQLGKRSGPRACNPWAWLRSTPLGFWVLHVGLALLFLALMGVRVHLWERVGFVSELLASGNFTYWGLMHISMSFWSSR